VRVLLVLVLAAVPVLGDPLKDYSKQRRALRKEERAFWKDFRRRGEVAQKASRAPYREMVAAMNSGKGKVLDFVIDHAPLRELYEEYAALQKKRADSLLAFAGSGHASVPATLSDELLDIAEEIDEADAELWGRKGSGGWGFFDQAPAVRRHGLEQRRMGLCEAFARAQAAGFVVAKVYPRAARADGRRTRTRRVLVLDALRACKGGKPLLVSLLRAPEGWLRIGAVEALAGQDSSVDVSKPLLLDESRAVRLALIESMQDKAWIEPLSAVMDQLSGVVRARAAAALERLGGKPAPKTPATTSFYGIPGHSGRVAFLLDGTDNLHIPASHQVQRTRAYHDWTVGKRDWVGKHEAHHAVMAEQLDKALGLFTGKARFCCVMVKESAAVKSFGPAGVRQRKRAVLWFTKHAPRGYRCELANLKTAVELMPEVAEVFLIGSGTVQGGRVQLPEAAVAAFLRWNRFLRLVVHTIRICDAGPDAERYMKGLADASGGTYRSMPEPP